MAGRSEEDIVPPVKDRCTPLATVRLRKRIRSGQNNGHSLPKKTYTKDTL